MLACIIMCLNPCPYTTSIITIMHDIITFVFTVITVITVKALRHGPPTLSDYVIRLHSAMYTTTPHAQSVYAVHARIIIPRGPRVVNTGALRIMYTCTCTCTCIMEDTWTAPARFRLQ